MHSRVVLAAVLLLGACGGSPDGAIPAEVDFTTARRLESEGRALDAIVEYARIVRKLTDQPATHARVHVAWARLLEALARLRFREVLSSASPEVRKSCDSLSPWDGPSSAVFLSAGAANHWIEVLGLGAEPKQLEEAAGAVARLYAAKIDQPALRRGRLEPEGEISERCYRRHLAEAAADYACYALSRLPSRPPEETALAARLLRRAARELTEMSSCAGIQDFVARRWGERAKVLEDTAKRVEAGTADEQLKSNDLRQAVEKDTNALLNSAIDHVNKANSLLSRRADESAVMDALERSMRDFIAGREGILEPTPLQKRTLDVFPIAADALRSLAFKN